MSRNYSLQLNKQISPGNFINFHLLFLVEKEPRRILRFVHFYSLSLIYFLYHFSPLFDFYLKTDGLQNLLPKLKSPIVKIDDLLIFSPSSLHLLLRNLNFCQDSHGCLRRKYLLFSFL